MIYKIFRSNEWADLQTEGSTAGAPIDLQDGFIHLSTAATVKETAALHFAGATGLWLAAIDESKLGDALKWEPSRGGTLFPHLFDRLALAQIEWCVEMPLVGETHQFPKDLA